MRRVVVTGMGIVSSIGSNMQEVTASLHAGRSGITRAENFAELGFRSQVQGAPTSQPGRHARSEGDAVPRRRHRLEPCGDGPGDRRQRPRARRSSNERTGIIMGSGGPSTRAIVEAADVTRAKGPNGSALSRFRSRWLDRVGDPVHVVQDQGRQLFHLLGLRDLQPLHRRGLRTHSDGQAGLMFAGGCEELDWTLSVLFDAMGAMSSAFNRRRRAPRAPTTRTATDS